MSHSFNRRWEEVDSRLLVVGSQIASLTPGPSFDHNLGCRCPNDTYEAILGIYTSWPFHWYKEHLNERFFDPWTWALSFWESRRTPTSHFWGCEFHLHLSQSGVATRRTPKSHFWECEWWPHTSLKVGLWQKVFQLYTNQLVFWFV
jgi:hypothetical protein